MRESTQSTTWTCNNCGIKAVLTDGYQNVPPEGWRLIELLPTSVNMALEPTNPTEVKMRVLCEDCMTTPIVLVDVFKDRLGGG